MRSRFLTNAHHARSAHAYKVAHTCCNLSFLTCPVNKRAEEKAAHRKGSKMQLFVQGQALHALNVTSQTTVDELKGILAQEEGIPAVEQVLAYGGVPLEDDSFICQSVPELATLSLTARVVGGKWVRMYFQTLIFLYTHTNDEYALRR